MFIAIAAAFFSTFIGSVIYTAGRFAYYFQAADAKYYYIFFFVMVGLIVAGSIKLMNTTSSLGSLLYISAATLLGFYLYLLLSTIVVDVLGIFIRINPLYKGITIISMALLVSIYGIWNAANVRTTEIAIPLKGLTAPVRAAHLTDTHIGHFRSASNLQRIINKINDNNVDIVFFTGDLLDSRVTLNAESIAPLKNLNAPVYFVEGNHDIYTGVEAIKSRLRNLGINVLTNEISIWNGIQIIGLNHMLPDSAKFDLHAGPGRETIKSVLGKLEIDNDKPSVLLTHGPNGVKYAEQKGIDLFLAGHTHGGQVFPFTLLANHIYEFNKGLHNRNGMSIYVCQGTGTFGPPMRVGTKSELAIINMVPKESTRDKS